MAFDNTKLADELISLILADSLSTFPSPVAIDWLSIVHRLSDDHQLEDSTLSDKFTWDTATRYLVADSKPPIRVAGDNRDIREVIHDQLIWLNDEQFVRYEPNFTLRYGANGDPMVSILSKKSSTIITKLALERINKYPESLSNGKSLKTNVINFAASTGDKITSSLAAELVRMLFKSMPESGLAQPNP